MIILAVSMIIVFLDIEDAHHSMPDVRATLKCFKEMMKLGGGGFEAIIVPVAKSNSHKASKERIPEDVQSLLL